MPTDPTDIDRLLFKGLVTDTDRSLVRAQATLVDGRYIPLTSTRYVDVGGATRPGPTTHDESLRDMSACVGPLMQAHAQGLHGWGIASGLRISATLGSAGVQIEPGIALDARGRHIWLVDGGRAELDPEADTAPPHLPSSEVEQNGVTLPTAGFKGKHHVTVEWRQSYDPDRPVVDYHTPWLRLMAVSGFVDDGARVVLGLLTLDAHGNVVALDLGLRRLVGAIGGKVVLRAPQLEGSATEDAAYAELRPRAGGGLQIAVPKATDGVSIQRADGQSFASMEIKADQVVAASGGKDVLTLDTAHGRLRFDGAVNLGAGGLGVGDWAQVPQGQLRVMGSAALGGGLSVGDGQAQVPQGQLKVTGGAALGGGLSVGDGQAQVPQGQLKVTGTATLGGGVTAGGIVRAGGYAAGSAGVDAFNLEVGGASPTPTSGQATIYFHHHGVVAHQLRYSGGTLHLERAGNGYGTSDTPSLTVGGNLAAGGLVRSGGGPVARTGRVVFDFHASPHASWKAFETGSGHREVSQRVAFNPPFPSGASVSVSAAVARFDILNNHNARLVVDARNVSPSGFDLVVLTWADTKMWSVTASWVACA